MLTIFLINFSSPILMLYCLFNDVLLKLAFYLFIFFAMSVKMKILTEQERKDEAHYNEQ